MGYFPNWTLKTSGAVMPDERLPTGQTVIAGLQHVVAMFGSTVLAPVLMGFDPNVAIFFSGIATLLFFVITRGQLPSYLGFFAGKRFVPIDTGLAAIGIFLPDEEAHDALADARATLALLRHLQEATASTAIVTSVHSSRRRSRMK